MPYRDRRIHRIGIWTGVNLSDTNEITLPDPSARYTEDDNFLTDESSAQYPRALHANVTGWVRAMAVDDDVEKPIYLVAGTTYPHAYKRIFLTGASGITDGQLLVGR